ncbi:hypothetical protein QGP82_15560 [Leptothoe sp. LEGE 181152]|nr:hypothetical protein [Leptothoe sp. LEGE 181152]
MRTTSTWTDGSQNRITVGGKLDLGLDSPVTQQHSLLVNAKPADYKRWIHS